MSICLPTNQTIEDFLTAANTCFIVTITEESSNEQQAQEESSNEQQEKSNVKSSTSQSSKIQRTMTERTGLKMKHSMYNH